MNTATLALVHCSMFMHVSTTSTTSNTKQF